MKITRNLLILFLIVSSTLLCSSQSGLNQVATSNTSSVKTGNPERSFALFEEDDLLEVTLKLDMVAYLRKNLKGNAKDGVLTFHLSQYSL